MHTKDKLKKQMHQIGIKNDDTILIHSSMKAIGLVENGADGVLDAFEEYMTDGLLVFPTHTWIQINNENRLFDVKNEPSCVGILSNIFMKRPGVIRSWHPTHSVAAKGVGAARYTEGEERLDTPCHRNGCWGKLYDLNAKVLFVGCSLKNNTLLHGVEEWAGVTNRISDSHEKLKILTPEGKITERPSRRHFEGTSKHYAKIKDALLETEIALKGKIGDAESVLCDVKKMVDLTMVFLGKDADFFSYEKPAPRQWYEEFAQICK